MISKSTDSLVQTHIFMRVYRSIFEYINIFVKITLSILIKIYLCTQDTSILLTNLQICHIFDESVINDASFIHPSPKISPEHNFVETIAHNLFMVSHASGSMIIVDPTAWCTTDTYELIALSSEYFSCFITVVIM